MVIPKDNSKLETAGRLRREMEIDLVIHERLG